MPGHAAEAVVRVVRERVHGGEVFFQITDSVLVGVLHAQDAVALREIDPAIGAALDMHGGIRFVVKNAAVFAILVEHHHLVMRWSRITRRPEVGVT